MADKQEAYCKKKKSNQTKEDWYKTNEYYFMEAETHKINLILRKNSTLDSDMDGVRGTA